jgi:hypothetical protein
MCSGNKKGTFDVNIVFTATLACTKRALFITTPLFGIWHFATGERALFVSSENLGGGLDSPGSYAPDEFY